MNSHCVWILLSNFIILGFVISVDVDENGYILYCPCMGRFGNQADSFLGVLSFAKSLNRTLVLPPWVEFRPHSLKSTQVPFDRYFKVAPLLEYHRVMTMEAFMADLAPDIWPQGKRIVFCYSARGNGGCNAKEGNPFGPFWDTFDIEFDQSELYGPLSHSSHSQFELDKWRNKYPPEKFLVMAFTGAPAAFPVSPSHAPLHRFLKWSEDIEGKANEFIEEKIEKPFIGIHLRNGIDWKNACKHASTSPQLFASPQCLGTRGEEGRVTPELCFPSDKTIIKQVKSAVKKHSAKTVFVATDDRDMIPEFKEAFQKVEFIKYAGSNPHVDLAILGKADYFIGNCVSTFTAFSKRERDAAGLPSGFWAFPLEKPGKEEL